MTAPMPSPAPGARRRPTATSNFGVGRRESHDAGAFYARFGAPVLSDDTAIRRPRHVDAIWCQDASEMSARVEESSVALVVTSPPYFAGKAYEEALGEGHVPADYGEYLAMLHRVFRACYRALEPGGRIAVNVANLGRKPFRSLSADVIDILQQLGFLLRGEIVWQKSHAAGGSCAWGTYQRPGNPVLRDVTERVIVASKGRFDRALSPEARERDGWPHVATITMDDFIDATTDVWDLPAESATRVGHPAPFPVELPRRLIDLYTYRGDLVLDPFMGSGTTAVAAVRTGRRYVGFDTDPGYVRIAEERVAAERMRLLGEPDRRVAVTRARSEAAGGAESVDFRDRAVREGHKARELAAATLLHAGFSELEEDAKLADVGVDVSFRARDCSGATWLFEVCGAFSLTRPGLRRTEMMWRALGKAAVVDVARRADPNRDDLGPLVLLTTDVPPRQSAGGRALAAVTGDAAPVRDVIPLLDDTAFERLRRHASTT